MAAINQADERKLGAQIEKWRSELNDLSLRNRLLNFKVNRSSAVEIAMPGAASVLARLRSGPWRFHYPPNAPDEELDDATDTALRAEDPDLDEVVHDDELVTTTQSASDLSRILRNLERRAAAEYLDRGLWVLYLGVGMLEWTDADNKRLESPLVLVPVELARPNPNQPFRVKLTEEETTTNPSLAVKLLRDAEVTLPVYEEDEPIDQYLIRVRAAVAKADASAIVSGRVVLSYFSFHKEVMYRDLLDNEEKIAAHPLVRAIGLGPMIAAADDFAFVPTPEDQLDEVAPPEMMVSVLDCDSTQRRCILAARDGGSFVMDGPPGSGKSQTITNMIAELISAGKSVLFVSEKAAALDVVKNRLESRGLGAYVLELHSHNATRKQVAQRLGQALRTAPQTRSSMTSYDRNAVIRRRQELSAYARALHEVRDPLHRSVYDALARCAELDDAPITQTLSTVGTTLDDDKLNEIIDAGVRLSRAWGPVDRAEDFIWRELADPDWALAARANIASRVASLAETHEQLRQLGDDVAYQLGLDAPDTIDGHRALRDVCRLIDLRPKVVPSWLSTADLAAVKTRADECEALSTERTQHVASLVAVPAWHQLDIASGARAAEAATDLAGLGVTRFTDPRAALESLDSAIIVLEHLPETLAQIARLAQGLAEDVGWRSAGTDDLRTLRQLAELAQLCDVAVRPQSSWIAEALAPMARAAVVVLRPVVGEYRRLASQVRASFSEEIIRFNVESLYESTTDTNPNLSRLSATGRKNRKNLKACTRNGKLGRDVIGVLPAARDWQRVRTDLAATEAERAAVLADAYSGAERTDFDALETALAAAERALELLGEGDRRRLANYLGPERSVELQAIVTSGAELTRLLDEVEREIDEHLDARRDWEQLDLTAVTGVIRRAQAAARDLKSEVREVRGVPTVAGCITALVERAAIGRIDATFDLTATEDRALLGEGYDGSATDWSALRDGVAWAELMRAQVGATISNEVGARLATATPPTVDYDVLLATAEKGTSEVLEVFEPDTARRLEEDMNLSVDAALELCAQLDASIDDIEEWSLFVAARHELAEAGIGEVVSKCEQRQLASEHVPRVIERSVLASWIEAVLLNDRDLAPIRSVDRDQIVDEFRRLDKLLVDEAIAGVITACNGRRPKLIAGPGNIIKREAEKKTRHMPVRELMAKAGESIKLYKPCFMMSPMSVSQFLPPDLVFDVVIFDEASQVRPSDAVNAIYRGRQLVVAGDERQLPPTAFFERSLSSDDDTWDEEQLDDFESVLKTTKASGLIELPLRWHYRSRHEGLITFSNYSFYDGSLITYPGADQETGDLGVGFVYVDDGIYTRGGARDNPVEARRVAERVIDHAKSFPKRTLGVVALSEAQAICIQNAVDYLRDDHRELDEWFASDRLNGFFVKNLENVQGDERDTILISIGYARDEHGKFTMHFGPVNAENGWRRLNVAITRARTRIEVISSIRSGDITETGSEGVRHLKRYLDYAERGIAALAGADQESLGDAESPFEEAVLRVIRRLGYDAVSQVGMAGYRVDIGVRHPHQPGRFAIGIECDGAAYHSSRVARDRDRLRQEVLEGLGWTLHRIWGPAWFRSQDAETKRLRDAIDAAIRGEQLRPSSKSEARAAAVTIEELDREPVHEWVQPYLFSSVRYRGSVSMDDPSARRDLERIIKAIVEVEGPIVPAYLALRVREAWGAGRLGAKMQKAFDECLATLVARREVTRLNDDGALVLDTDRRIPVRSPAVDGTTRGAKEIPRVELEAATHQLVRAAHTIDRAELGLRVSRIFGWARRGADIQAALDRTIDTLTKARVLVEDEYGHLKLSD